MSCGKYSICSRMGEQGFPFVLHAPECGDLFARGFFDFGRQSDIASCPRPSRGAPRLSRRRLKLRRQAPPATTRYSFSAAALRQNTGGPAHTVPVRLPGLSLRRSRPFTSGKAFPIQSALGYNRRFFSTGICGFRRLRPFSDRVFRIQLVPEPYRPLFCQYNNNNKCGADMQ